MPDIRQSSAGFLTSSLQQLGGGDASTAQSVAGRLEEAVFAQHNGDTGNPYREQMRTLALDLSKNNPDLGQQLLAGQVQPNDIVNMDPEGLKSDEQAAADEAMREQGLRDSIGTEKIPVYADNTTYSSEEAAAQSLQQEGEVSAQQESMGEEGDFKQRAQPKIKGLEGIEFESGL